MVRAPSAQRFGRYELLTELGRGGMAELHLGQLLGVGGFAKVVAIKRMLPHLSSDKQFVELFLNEGRIAARLSHPNVCQVYELGEVGDQLFLAMEYLEGVSWEELAPLLPADPVRTLRVVAGVIAQACDGLHYAHELRDVSGAPTPVIHRDVSPQNLFVTVDGVCKVLDFGVSKMLTEGTRTRSGVVKGKLPYMSPEQIQGERVDARSDVFATGIVLWEALTGRRLFDRSTDYLIWNAVLGDAIPPVSAHEAGYGPELDAVVARALERDRDRRYPSARALADDLRRAANGVGGAYGPAELAELVRDRGAAHLEERSRRVALALGSTAAREPDAADTLQEAAVADDAGETMSLRGKAVPITRPTRSTRRRWPLLALAAAGAAAALGVVATRDPSAPRAPAGAAARAPVPADARPAPASGPADAGPDMAEAGRAPPDAEVPSAEASGAAAPTGDVSGPPRDSVRRPSSDAAAAPRPGSRRGATTRAGSAASAPAGLRAPGFLSIDSQPYARVYVDGVQLVETTPLYRRTVPAGPHQIRLVLEDGRERRFQVQIEPGNEVNLKKQTWD